MLVIFILNPNFKFEQKNQLLLYLIFSIILDHVCLDLKVHTYIFHTCSKAMVHQTKQVSQAVTGQCNARRTLNKLTWKYECKNRVNESAARVCASVLDEVRETDCVCVYSMLLLHHTATPDERGPYLEQGKQWIQCTNRHTHTHTHLSV